MKSHILAILIVFSLNKLSFAQEYELKFLQKIPLKNYFNTEDYSGGIQNWQISQDSNGIIYVANNRGLLEFDGSKWNTHYVPETPRLRSVKVTTNDKIFVGGQGQIGFFEKEHGQLRYNSLNTLIPENKPKIAETWKIIEHNNAIYFNTESEIYVYKNNTIQALILPGYMRYMHKVEGRLFAQFYDKGLYEIIENKFVQIPGTNLPFDIVSMIKTDSELFLLTREGGIYQLKRNTVVEVNTGPELGTINDAILLKSKQIAIGTQSNGLFIFDQDFNLIKHLSKNQGLSDRTVKALFEDNFNNLWVALNNGIDYLKFSLPFSLINEEFGIEGTGYAGTKFNSKVYLGTNNGVFALNSSPNKTFRFIEGSEGQVYGFSNLESDLFLNHNRGLFEIDNNKLRQINNIGNWSVLKTAKPNIIVGNGYRGVSFYERKNNAWQYVRSIANFDENAGVLEFENAHSLWASHNPKGLYQFELDKDFNLKRDILHFDESNGLPSKQNIKIYNINDKLLFTTEKGIFEFNHTSSSFEPNKFLNNLIGTGLVQNIHASNASIYYIQDDQIGELREESFGKYKNFKNTFRHINHLLNDDQPSISILDTNNVLFSAKEGFILYNPKNNFKEQSTFDVLVKSITIEKENDSLSFEYLNTSVPIEISRNHTLKLSIAAPFFDGFESLKYSFKLSPLQSNWTNWSSLNTKEYGHLPSGDYTLQVKALNIYENESAIKTIRFTVLTPWYLRNWALLIYALILLFILTLIPLYQRFHFKKEKTVLQERKAIALKIKDQKIDKLENEKLKTEIDLKNDQLTTITMQLVKNNEFIQNIQKDLLTSLEQNAPKGKLRKISKNIDTELSKDQSWDEFAYHFDQVHGNYLQKLSENNIKLSPREIKLAAFLRMNMSSKEIAVMLNITLRGVELARYRLRKKLNLTREQNLVEYLISLDND